MTVRCKPGTVRIEPTHPLPPPLSFERFGIARADSGQWAVVGVRKDGTRAIVAVRASRGAVVGFVEGMSYAEKCEVPRRVQTVNLP